jgi:hypothetical protein
MRPCRCRRDHRPGEPDDRRYPATLWAPETLHTSRDLLILVEQSAESVDQGAEAGGDGRSTGPDGRRCPAAGDELAVPAQDRGPGDQQAEAAGRGE